MTQAKIPTVSAQNPEDGNPSSQVDPASTPDADASKPLIDKILPNCRSIMVLLTRRFQVHSAARPTRTRPVGLDCVP